MTKSYWAIKFYFLLYKQKCKGQATYWLMVNPKCQRCSRVIYIFWKFNFFLLIIWMAPIDMIIIQKSVRYWTVQYNRMLYSINIGYTHKYLSIAPLQNTKQYWYNLNFAIKWIFEHHMQYYIYKICKIWENMQKHCKHE